MPPKGIEKEQNDTEKEKKRKGILQNEENALTLRANFYHIRWKSEEKEIQNIKKTTPVIGFGNRTQRIHVQKKR